MGKFIGTPPVAYSKKLARQVGPDGAILIGFLLLRWLDSGKKFIWDLATEKELEEVAGLELEEELPLAIEKCSKKELLIDEVLNIKKIEELLKCQLQKSLTKWKNQKRTSPEFPDTFYFRPVKDNYKYYYHSKIPFFFSYRLTF